jgi:hypothetical protein
VHFSHDAVDVLPVQEAVALLRKSGVRGALVSSSNDDGTRKLYDAAPDLIVPSLRPYRSRGEISTWARDASVIAHLEQRLARLLNWPVENGEGLQILRYGPGTEYKPHYDYFDPAAPGTASILKRGGQRVATVVMYLNDPQAGGATVFPDVQFECLPVRGNAVFFNYSQPDPSSRSLHAGAPVLRGEKWIATKWLREGRFD